MHYCFLSSINPRAGVSLGKLIWGATGGGWTLGSGTWGGCGSLFTTIDCGWNFANCEWSISDWLDNGMTSSSGNFAVLFEMMSWNCWLIMWDEEDISCWRLVLGMLLLMELLRFEFSSLISVLLANLLLKISGSFSKGFTMWEIGGLFTPPIQASGLTA